MFKAFGASPTGINFSKAYSSLQTKVVEGQENPLAIIYIAKLCEVQKFCSMTGHMWDGQWILANGKRWAGLLTDVQAVINKHVTSAVIKQRDDIRRCLTFNTPDVPSFRETLSKASFYAEWRATNGKETMAKLEKCSGGLI